MISTERLVPLICILSGLMLIGSELLDTFIIENPEGEAVELVGAAGRHGFSLGLLGLVGILATLVAARFGSRPAAIAVAICGLAALVLILAVDLPDLGAADLVEDPNRDYVQGKAVADDGLWISLGSSMLLTLGGALLAALTSARPERTGRVSSRSSQRKEA
jgi:hypothetical protein